jgi:hypothetical protein
MQRHNLNVKQIKVTSLAQIEWLIATQVRPELQDTRLAEEIEKRELGDGVSQWMQRRDAGARRLFI